MQFIINGIFSTDKIGTADIIDLPMDYFAVLVGLVKQNYLSADFFFGLSREDRLVFVKGAGEVMKKEFKSHKNSSDDDLLKIYEDYLSVNYNILNDFLKTLKQQYPSFDC